MVPLKKRSKRAQKEYYGSKRSTWHGIAPMTRVAPNGKGYDRKRIKQRERNARYHGW